LKVGDKVFASFGRYNNMDNRSIARAASPIRIVRTDSYISRADGSIIATIVQGNETGKIILPDLKPMYTDEFVAGYSRPFATHWSVESGATIVMSSMLLKIFLPVTVKQVLPVMFMATLMAS